MLQKRSSPQSQSPTSYWALTLNASETAITHWSLLRSNQVLTAIIQLSLSKWIRASHETQVTPSSPHTPHRRVACLFHKPPQHMTMPSFLPVFVQTFCQVYASSYHLLHFIYLLATPNYSARYIPAVANRYWMCSIAEEQQYITQQ